VEESNWFSLTIAAGVIFTAFLATIAIGWQKRARAAKRWKALLDAYARREIAREARKKARKRLRMPSSLT
jgi:hypothetical protein